MSTEHSFARRLISATLKTEKRHRVIVARSRGRHYYSLWRRCVAATLNVTLPIPPITHLQSTRAQIELQGARIHHSTLRAAVLLAVLLGGVALAGSNFGRPGMITAMAGALAVIGYAYWNGDRLALQAMRARPASEQEVPQLYRIVRELSVDARRPMPSIYLSPTQAPNAFAVGRTRRNAAVCCTDGILRILDERELRGVIAHELSHIHNRDVLISSTIGALAGVVLFVLNLVWLTPAGRSDDEGGSTMLGSLLLILLGGPLAASLIRLAVSRSCEYRADAAGASLTGDPLALASALRKLEKGIKLLPLPPEPRLQVRGHMMAAAPFRADTLVSRLFSTHAPIRERVARLEHMAGHHAAP